MTIPIRYEDKLTKKTLATRETRNGKVISNPDPAAMARSIVRSGLAAAARPPADQLDILIASRLPRYFYKFNEPLNAGAIINYGFEANRNLTSMRNVVLGQPGFVQNTGDTCALFDGSTSYAGDGGSANTTNFTFEGWFFINQIPSVTAVMFGFTGLQAAIFYLNADGRIALNANHKFNVALSNSSLSAEQAYHIAIVIGDSTWAIYINGVLDASGEGGGFAAVGDGFFVGADILNDPINFNLSALVSRIVVYAADYGGIALLTPEDIAADYALGSASGD